MSLAIVIRFQLLIAYGMDNYPWLNTFSDLTCPVTISNSTSLTPSASTLHDYNQPVELKLKDEQMPLLAYEKGVHYNTKFTRVYDLP